MKEYDLYGAAPPGSYADHEDIKFKLTDEAKGNKILAIKNLRGATGLSLKNAKDFMDWMYCHPNETVQITVQSDWIDSLKSINEIQEPVLEKKKVYTAPSAKLLLIVQEAIRDDNQELANDVLELYLKHFEL